MDARLGPKKVRGREDAWWYEDRGGIDVMHEVRVEGIGYVRTDRIRIPWRLLLIAAQRSSGREIVVRGKKGR